MPMMVVFCLFVRCASSNCESLPPSGHCDVFRQSGRADHWSPPSLLVASPSLVATQTTTCQNSLEQIFRETLPSALPNSRPTNTEATVAQINQSGNDEEGLTLFHWLLNFTDWLDSGSADLYVLCHQSQMIGLHDSLSTSAFIFRS